MKNGYTTNEYVVFDTYAWLLYFSSPDQGQVISKYFESAICATPTIVLTELKRKFMQAYDSGEDTLRKIEQKLGFIRNKTKLVPLDRELAEFSGEIYHEKRKKVKDWPIADSIILATAQSLSAKILTGDPHFKGMENVIFLG